MRYLPPRYLFRRAEILRSIVPGDRFLEVGAGDLTLTTELLDHFGSGIALEPSENPERFLLTLDQDVQARLEVQSSELDAFEPPGTFDCVVSCEVMEHVEDDAGFARSLVQNLRPGGQLIVSVPAHMRFWTVHDQLVGHLRRYDRAQLVTLFSNAGCTDIDVRSYGYPWINLLRLPRLILAKLQQDERSEMTTAEQTASSNHRQIPAGLASSPVRFLTRPALVAPLAFISRAFNRLDRSDGFVVVAKRR